MQQKTEHRINCYYGDFEATINEHLRICYHGDFETTKTRHAAFGVLHICFKVALPSPVTTRHTAYQSPNSAIVHYGAHTEAFLFIASATPFQDLTSESGRQESTPTRAGREVAHQPTPLACPSALQPRLRQAQRLTVVERTCSPIHLRPTHLHPPISMPGLRFGSEFVNRCGCNRYDQSYCCQHLPAKELIKSRIDQED